ncbi:MAG: hypothetical protein R2712_12740 [Vicinamibacterales bacterium]
MRRLVPLILATLLCSSPAAADPAARLLQLASIPGTAGHEAAVREAIEMALPASARVRADNLGTMTILRRGSAGPHLLIVAPLDEPGLLVSAITNDGYLRVHRHTPAPAHPLGAQFLVGQPVLVRTASGRVVPGVTATPSTHLNGFRPQEERTRIQTLDDLWVDVGATSRDEAAALGIRMLDAVSLRERAADVGGGRVAGVAVSYRAAAAAVVEAVRRQGEAPTPRPPGTVSIAWVGQSQFGNRGLLRLLETLKPDRVVMLRGGVAPSDDAAGSAGEPGQGPVVAASDAYLAERAAAAGVTVQTLPAERLAVNLGAAYAQTPVHVVSVPVLFAQTPVEMADARDVDALARLVGSLAGYGPLRDADPAGDEPEPASAAPEVPAAGGADELEGRLMETFSAIAREYGVSGHEGPVRDTILKRLPATAKPQVDAKGNIRVTMGEGARPLVFVAHMDEVGFEIDAIEPDGTMRVRTRGGMYLSVYEAHPVLIHTPQGPVGAVLAPRRGYGAATRAQPELDDLRVVTGATTPAGVKASGRCGRPDRHRPQAGGAPRRIPSHRACHGRSRGQRGAGRGTPPDRCRRTHQPGDLRLVRRRGDGPGGRRPLPRRCGTPRSTRCSLSTPSCRATPPWTASASRSRRLAAGPCCAAWTAGRWSPPPRPIG